MREERGEETGAGRRFHEDVVGACLDRCSNEDADGRRRRELLEQDLILGPIAVGREQAGDGVEACDGVAGQFGEGIARDVARDRDLAGVVGVSEIPGSGGIAGARRLGHHDRQVGAGDGFPEVDLL